MARFSSELGLTAAESQVLGCSILITNTQLT